jgi:dCMP deaminase
MIDSKFKWYYHWIGMAQYISRKSKDRSTKCGAVIVDEHQCEVASGYNGFPRDIDDENNAYHARPLKYDMTEHAERNAIYAAAAGRGGTRGCTMYLAHSPHFGICTDCARAIIQAGIERVIGPAEKFEGKGEQWLHNVRVAYHMLKEAGVEIRYINIPVKGGGIVDV